MSLCRFLYKRIAAGFKGHHIRHHPLCKIPQIIYHAGFAFPGCGTTEPLCSG